MNYSPAAWQNEYLADEIVELKPLEESDFDELFLAASDPLIWEQHPASDRYLKEVFTKYFNEAITGKAAYLIIEKASGRVIGCTRYYDYHPENSDISIGFTFLSRHYWGGSYNRRSKKMMLNNAFKFVDLVYFHIGAQNIRSQIATERLGAVKVGERLPEGEGLHFEYVIQKHNWVNKIG
ncbi:MAG: GNAT family N-acetyltransferase [Chitinophagaceae bacterium]